MPGRDRGRILWRVVFGTAAVAVLGVMGAVLLAPGPVDQPYYGKVLRGLRRLQEYGFPDWIDYTMVEAAANVLLFVPLGFLAAFLLPARLWWLALLLCVGMAAGVEAFQDLFLPRRQGDLQDVLNNGAGALLGVAAAALGRTVKTRFLRSRAR